MMLTEQNPPEPFTVESITDELDITSASASMVLKRLRTWGYIRLVSFEEAEGGVGRRKHVYELTKMAHRYAEHIRRQEE